MWSFAKKSVGLTAICYVYVFCYCVGTSCFGLCNDVMDSLLLECGDIPLHWGRFKDSGRGESATDRWHHVMDQTFIVELKLRFFLSFSGVDSTFTGDIVRWNSWYKKWRNVLELFSFQDLYRTLLSTEWEGILEDVDMTRVEKLILDPKADQQWRRWCWRRCWRISIFIIVTFGEKCRKINRTFPTIPWSNSKYF